MDEYLSELPFSSSTGLRAIPKKVSVEHIFISDIGLLNYRFSHI